MQVPNADGDGSGSGGVRNDLSGAANGPVVQVGSADTVNVTAPVSAESSEQDHEQAVPEQRKGGGCFWALLAVLALIGTVLSQCGENSAIPEESDPWPEGVRRDMLISTVFEGLQSCSYAVVLAPVNCPQSENQAGTGENVSWSLRGDPMDGARIAYQDGVFFVYGNAVMTVSYEYPPTYPNFATKIVPYLAKVSSTGAAITSLETVDPSQTQSIVKRDPVIAQEQLAAVLRGAFGRCAASTQPTMPADCPDAEVIGAADNTLVRWSFAGDPAINIRKDFDPVTGLISVVGSYAATAQYTDILGDRSVSQSGTYIARLVVESGAPEVLEIETCNMECTE
ncbi:hypothetical protein [Saccharopolyspora sp. 5N708]|uniref:hypothetical protein n=1 Tax=Saccharopolyspora sp. 5N708 TaxID=3457424 RepID=UPI003FD00F04